MNLLQKIGLAGAFLLSHTMGAVYVEISSQSDFKSKKQQYSNSIVSFYSPDCPHCKIFMPAFQNKASRYNDIGFLGVNIDDPQLRGLARSYRVTRTPTVYVIDMKKNRKTKIEGTGDAVVEAAEEILKSKKNQKSQTTS